MILAFSMPRAKLLIALHINLTVSNAPINVKPARGGGGGGRGGGRAWGGDFKFLI